MKKREFYETPQVHTVECMVENGIAFSQGQEILIDELYYESYDIE